MGEQRPKTSWVWPYFEVRTLPDGETVACCKTCSKTFKHGGSTSNLINHLAKTHKLFPPKGKRSSVNANSSSSPSTVVTVASLLPTSSATSSLSAASLNHITHPQPQEPQSRPHPLEFLFGTWRGNGRGYFPGINDFEYAEELNIAPDESNRGWLYYRQKTWNPAKGNANFHSEMGYIRCPGLGDHVELVLAQPTGIASTEEGRVEGTTVSLRSTKIARSSTAKPPHVTQYERILRVDVANGTLDYNFNMATTDKAMKEHLVASLHKVAT